MERGRGREELPTAGLLSLPPQSVAGAWTRAFTVLLFHKKITGLEPTSWDSLGQQAKKSTLEEQTHGNRG